MKACNRIRNVAALAAVLTLGNWTLGSFSSAAWGEDAPAGNAAPAPHDAESAKKPAGKDPTASAFALPSGAKLSEKQQSAYDALKADKQPELKEAIDDLQTTKSGETAQAAKKVRDLRADIRKKINDILYPVTAPSAAGDANGGSSDGGRPNGYGYGVPYGGYYPNWAYGGYYPYHYHQRTNDGKLSGTKNGAKNGGAGDHKQPPHPPAARPAHAAATSNGAKR